MPCLVEVISTGNELLLGNTVNTNAAWIARRVTQLGGRVTRITTVGDDLKEIGDVVSGAMSRKPDIIITSGGIGPTFDDMTITAVARVLHLPLKLNKSALQMIRDQYRRRFPNRRMILTQARRKMAIIPSEGVPLRNPTGMAPAILLRKSQTWVFCLPGVPRELKAIFRDSLSRFIAEKAGGKSFVEEWIRVDNVSESTLAPKIETAMREWPTVYIKSHPRRSGSKPFIKLHFSLWSSDPRTARADIEGTISSIMERSTGAVFKRLR